MRKGVYVLNTIQLRCFLDLTETLSYTKTAEKLFLTQPAVTRHIQLLENEIGFKLFIRTQKKVELTPAGISFAEDIKKLMTGLDTALLHAQDAENGFAGEIRVGILPGLLLENYASVFRDYTAIHGNVRFSVVAETMPFLEEMLHAGDLDLAVWPIEGIALFPELDYIKLMSKPLRLFYVPESVNVKPETTPELSEFRDSNIIIYPRRDTNTMRTFTRMCMDAGFSPNFDTSMKRNPDVSVAMEMMQLGNNVCLFHENIFLTDCDSFSSVALPELPEATIVLAWNKKLLSPRVAAFISYFESRTQQLGVKLC